MATYYNPAHETQMFAIKLQEQLTLLDALNNYHIEKYDLNPIAQRNDGIHYYQIKVVDKEEINYYRDMATLIVKEDGVQFGRTLDGYTIPYAKGCHTPKEVALAIIKRIRQVRNVTAVF